MGDGRTERYTLDELAAVMGMTARNVRSYATKQLIDKPLREGRRAVYDARHRAQLEWVRDRHEGEGLPLRVVRRMVERGDRPDPATLDLTDPRLDALGAAQVTPGATELATSIYVPLAGDHTDTVLLVRAVHRLVDAAGYVHYGDELRRAASYLRRSTWRRAVAAQEAAELVTTLVTAADGAGDALSGALADVHARLEAVPEAVVVVGPLLLTRHADDGVAQTRRAHLAPDVAADLLATPDLLASPGRAARLTTDAVSA